MMSSYFAGKIHCLIQTIHGEQIEELVDVEHGMALAYLEAGYDFGVFTKDENDKMIACLERISENRKTEIREAERRRVCAVHVS